jgi:hypothetical protein
MIKKRAIRKSTEGPEDVHADFESNQINSLLLLMTDKWYAHLVSGQYRISQLTGKGSRGLHLFQQVSGIDVGHAVIG